MKMTLLLISAFSAFGLTTAELDRVRQMVGAAGVTIDFTKSQANIASQKLDTWILANRGTLPNQITSATLTAGQRTEAATAMGGTYTNLQRVAFVNAVGTFHEIIVPPPPDKSMISEVAAAVNAQILTLFGPAIDAATPGLSNEEKVRAVKLVLALPR